MKKTIIFLAIVLFLLGCVSNPLGDSNNQNLVDQNNPLLGSDKDSYGCIPSAGYSWCEAKQKCLRSWEEACVAGASGTDKNQPANELKKAPATMQTVLSDLTTALNEMENLNKELQK